jgi:hypothetical protein
VTLFSNEIVEWRITVLRGNDLLICLMCRALNHKINPRTRYCCHEHARGRRKQSSFTVW